LNKYNAIQRSGAIWSAWVSAARTKTTDDTRLTRRELPKKGIQQNMRVNVQHPGFSGGEDVAADSKRSLWLRADAMLPKNGKRLIIKKGR